MCDANAGLLFDPNGTTQAKPPSVGKTTRDYLGLIRGFAQGEQTLFDTEAKYKPQFINQSLQGANQAAPDYLNLFAGSSGAAAQTQAGANTYQRQANVADWQNLGPQAVAAYRNANPEQSAMLSRQRETAQAGLGEQSALYKQLGDSASLQLAAGSRLDPGAVNRITTGTRNDWASRGLGTSAPAQLDEAMNLYGAGQGEMAQRQNFGLGVANAQASDEARRQNYALNVSEQGFRQEQLPWLSLAGGESNAPGAGMQLAGGAYNVAQGAGPTLINPGANYDTFNTAYNARAAAGISTANNQAQMLGGLMSY